MMGGILLGLFLGLCANSFAATTSTTSSSSASTACNDTSADPEGKASTNPPAGSDPTDNQKAGKGKKAACQALQQGVEQQAEAAYKLGSKNGMTGDNFQELKKGYDEYIKNREDCLNGQASAATMCMEGLSPDIANTASSVNSTLGQLTSSVSNTCSNFSNAMDIAKAGLTAFSGSCATAQGVCKASCSKAQSGLTSLQAKAKAALTTVKCTDTANTTCASALSSYTTALNSALTQAAAEQAATDETSVAGKLKTCTDKYSKQLSSAMQGILGMVAGLLQGNQCEEETDGTTTEVAGTVADTCILAENATLPECICKANPLTVGCSTALSYSKTSTQQLSGGLEDKNSTSTTTDSTSLDSGTTMQQAEMSPSEGGVGAPVGGGGAGIGGSSVGQGGAKAEAAVKKGLDANILAGTSGGGSTGKWSAATDKLRQYLPGGKKDPAMNVAGQQAWTKEVTSEGGKSNWDKVKDRYRENRATLLNTP